MTICSVDGCGPAKKLTKGLCPKHYQRLLRTGSEHVIRKLGRKTNFRKHPLYNAWAGMVNRCTNPNNTAYGRYGARGITVCERWRHFENYLADMGERPDGCSIDRIDPAGPYAPDNCRWADAKHQRANRTASGEARHREATSEAQKRRWERHRAANS